MKTPYPFLALILLLCSCAKQENPQEQGDRWNGYFSYLKTDPASVTLIAGRNIPVGSVYYGFDDEANFVVTYDCSASGWLISATHLFANSLEALPTNNPGAPKIGQFPYTGNHSPWQSTVSYSIPATSLPEGGIHGFVWAAHCIVHSPSGLTHTAWAEGPPENQFTDKDWGWYNRYFCSPAVTRITLYGTELTEDSLKLYLIDVTNNSSTLISAELVGDGTGHFDAAAFNESNNILYFADYNTGELWATDVNDDSPAFYAGDLTGTPASGTFYDGYYYYVDEETHTINRAGFNDDGTIQSTVALSTLPNTNPVSDIAMNPSGTNLYIVSNREEGTDLITWDVIENTFYMVAVILEPGAQLAFGSDGNLYAFEEIPGGDGSTRSAIVSTETGNVTIIDDGSSIVEEPLSDVSSGKTL